MTFQSYITSEFKGFDYGNRYTLANGQTWEQTEFYVWFYIWIYPNVTIYTEYGLFKMKVKNIDHAITVRQIF